MTVPLRVVVNGQAYERAVEPRLLLRLDVLALEGSIRPPRSIVPIEVDRLREELISIMGQ